MSKAIGRIDFHLHSYASNVTDYYAANAFARPACMPYGAGRLMGGCIVFAPFQAARTGA